MTLVAYCERSVPLWNDPNYKHNDVTRKTVNVKRAKACLMRLADARVAKWRQFISMTNLMGHEEMFDVFLSSAEFTVDRWADMQIVNSGELSWSIGIGDGRQLVRGSTAACSVGHPVRSLNIN